MSLELAAQHLASRGRKGDSMLVHMAPEEVSGLQALARAGGGTLTLNPDTGLPEANFLKRMLPMIIGAGLSVASGGTLTPMMAAMMTGGGYGLAKGSLKEGLMAGLGAYGGAGLAGGLTAAAGTAGAAGAGAGAGTAAIDSTMANALPVSSGAVAPAAGLGGQTFAQASQAANAAAANQAVNTAMTGAMPLSSNAGLAGNTFGMSAAPMTVTPPPSFAAMGRGLGALSEQAGRDAFMSNVGGGMGLAKLGGAAAAPMMFQEPEAMKKPYTGSVLDYDYEYDDTNRTNPFRKIPRRAADGGMMNSGPIEAMSDQNRMDTMMANGGQMFAAGGQVNLQGTFTAGDQGGGGQFGQANANGYQAAGSGGQIPGFSSSFGQMGGGGQMGGFDPRAVQANPQGFAQHMAQMGQREQQMPGSTMMGRPQGGSLQQFAAQMSPEQRAANQRQMEMMTGYGPNGFNHGGSNQMVGDMRYRPERDNATIAANQANSNFASYAAGGMASMARGGPSHLGDYSDGGRLLKGPGDGVSDSIPATIANKRPARLADGEFVVPARIVSELGNGSTEAGARKLYAMMDRVQRARGKTTGKNRVAVNSRAEKLLPA